MLNLEAIPHRPEYGPSKQILEDLQQEFQKEKIETKIEGIFSTPRLTPKDRYSWIDNFPKIQKIFDRFIKKNKQTLDQQNLKMIIRQGTKGSSFYEVSWVTISSKTKIDSSCTSTELENLAYRLDDLHELLQSRDEIFRKHPELKEHYPKLCAKVTLSYD